MTSVFDYNIVGNPKIFEQNRLMPHTKKEDFVYDGESDEWISNRFLNLNGVWEFLLNADKGIEFDFSFKGCETVVFEKYHFVHITAYYVYRQKLHKYLKLV